MIATWLALALAAGGNRAAIAEIELVGPLRGVVVLAGPGGETRVQGELLAGERRTLEVPVPLLGSTARFEPEVRWLRDEDPDARPGSARFVGWRSPPRDLLGEVPPGLLSRNRPPLEPERPMSSPVALLLLPAALVLGLAFRRRAAIAVGVSVLGAAAIAAVGWSPRAEARHVFVLEADLGSELWLTVLASCERAVLSPDAFRMGDGAVEVLPADARLVWRVPGREPDTWEVAGRGALIYQVRAVPAGGRSVSRAENRLRRLEAVWLREEGAWTFRGAWDFGTELPAPVAGPPPPGWIASGLPQGTTVMVGGGGAEWVRITGL